MMADQDLTETDKNSLTKAKYDADIANKMNATKDTTYTVAGKCCESGDILMKDIVLPKAEPNDLLVMYTTGAYGFSMASGYNRLLRPAVVFVKDGKGRIAVKRESYEDLISLDCGAND